MSETPTIVQPEADQSELDVTLTLCHNSQSPLWQRAAQLEANVFMENGYVTSPEELAVEYAPYAASTRMVAATKGDDVIGAMRVISYDPQVGLKTINDAKKGLLQLSPEGAEILEGLDLQQTVEVGTIALDGSYRGKTDAHSYMISSLYASIYALTLQENTPNVIASFDKGYYERFKKLFGPAVVALGPAADYMGSETVPVVMNVDRLKEHFISLNAEAYVDSITALGASMKNEY